MKLENIKLLILDDQNSYLQLIKLILEDIGLRHFSLAQSYDEALRAFNSFKPDACFLDIELNHERKNGIDVARMIRKQNQFIPIVFLTSYFQDDFYQKVRPIRPSSFMNKELSRLKLLQVVELVAMQIERLQLNPQGKAVPANSNGRENGNIPYFNSSQVFFRIGDSYKAIDIQKIAFFFAEDKLTYAKVENRNYPTNVQLKVLEKELYPKFIRCHKKFLVNTDAIDSILLKDGKIKLGKELLPIGYSYRKTLVQHLKLLK